MMNASKENARKAQEIASHLKGSTEIDFLRNFLVAAVRKLPSEAAYKADKARRRAKAKS